MTWPDENFCCYANMSDAVVLKNCIVKRKPYITKV